MSCRAVVLIAGAVAEGTGVILIGFPDLLPGALRLSRWLRRHARIATNRIRRLFGRPPVQHFVALASSMSASGSLRVSAIKGGVGPHAIMEEKIAFLLDRDKEAQKAMNALIRRVEDIETAMPHELAELRKGVEAHVARKLTAALDAYRELRVAGTSR